MNNRKDTIFHLVIIESALETLGNLAKNIHSSQKRKQKTIQNEGKAILDVSIHNHLMQGILDKNKRGRPDIIQNSLLLALGSRLNKEGYLRVYVHTRNDEIITFNPAVRIPRNYNRFIGLMQQLFNTKRIPPDSEDTLISIQSLTLEAFLKTLKPDVKIIFSEKGSETNIEQLMVTLSVNKRVVILIGGFPHGEISQKNLNLADLKVSIYRESLDTLVVLSYALNILERCVKM
jgi:rRNA small subunit pseudouridine methyltransferase Nep1